MRSLEEVVKVMLKSQVQAQVRVCSQDAGIRERVVEDGVFDRCKDKANVRRVGGLGQTEEHKPICSQVIRGRDGYSLWVQVEMGAIDLIESPKQVLGCSIDVVAP